MKPMKPIVIFATVITTFVLFPTMLQAQTAYTVTLAQVDTGRYPVITLYVNVRDSAGDPVPHLTKDDFAVTEDGTPVDITDFAGTGDVRPVDIVFVFDTTGSMHNEIEGVKQTSIEFAQKLTDEKRDYRLGLVAFGDNVRGVFKSNNDLTDRADEFKGWISTLNAEGGDGAWENDFGALKQASQMNFRGATQTIIILITDAPPHHYGDSPDGGHSFDDPDLTADRTATILKGKAITLYAVTYNDPDFHKLVDETNGEFYELTPTTDFTGIIDKIGTTISLQYRVSYRSPRPTYDGTRRDIRVSVGATGTAPSTGGGEYVEQHLVNFRSNGLVALGFLAPLLLALLVPLPFLLRRRQPAGPGPIPVGPPPAPPVQSVCPHCGRPLLRPGARFCNSCGQPVAGPAPAPSGYDQVIPQSPPAFVACARCGTPLRANARFCPNCGQRR